jgi:7-cyano-7-deazaguanine reductase
MDQVNQVAEGKKFPFLGVEEIATSELKTFPFDSPNQLIETYTPEFSAVCPFSGLPDIAELTIEYHPRGGACIELKSLKYYMTSFRMVGLYQEGVTKRIYNDLREVLKTDSICIRTTYNVRGGFVTTCTEGVLDS